MTKTLYPFQEKACRRILDELRRSSRTKAIMPCGTGKTLVGMHVRRQLAPKRSLIVAPSLALVKQLIDSYSGENQLDRVLVVCSDDSVAKTAREIYDIPSVTTDAGEIAAQLRKRGDLTIFSTYQSTPKIAESYELSRVPAFDLGVFDEAHRMTGSSETFTTALHQDAVPIRKRLFMTATPRVAAKQQADQEGYTFASMDDESQFGREAFSMSFREAIDKGFLTDYRVAVFVVKEAEIQQMVDRDDGARELAKRVALVRAIAQHRIRKVLAYHRTIRQMEWFAGDGLPRTFAAFQSAGEIDGSLWSRALRGRDSASARKAKLNEFSSLNGDSHAVLNNCQVLQEGVDCPAVDAVALVEPRSQPVDIVQIVGRAIRNSPDKKVSTIILPAFMPDDADCDVEQFVASSEFSHVWDVLSALKSHDERVHGWVDSRNGFSQAISEGHVDININMPDRMQSTFCDAISSLIVERFHQPVRLTDDLIWEWMQEHHEKFGKLPTSKTKTLAPDGSTWSGINSSMRGGYRGHPGNSSLDKLKKERMGVAPILTDDLIWECMQSYYKQFGKWPSQHVKELAPNGASWQSINSSMQNRFVTSSLSKLKKERLGIATCLTDDLIWEWMQEHYQKFGKWPNQTTQTLAPDSSTWKSIEASMENGRRGHQGHSSLSRLRKARLGVVTTLTDDLIWEWMQEHNEKFGEWPTSQTKELTPDGSKWLNVDTSMRKGYRGHPGNSSLAKLRRDRATA